MQIERGTLMFSQNNKNYLFSWRGQAVICHITVTQLKGEDMKQCNLKQFLQIIENRKPCFLRKKTETDPIFLVKLLDVTTE